MKTNQNTSALISPIVYWAKPNNFRPKMYNGGKQATGQTREKHLKRPSVTFWHFFQSYMQLFTLLGVSNEVNQTMNL
ncbi:MAG: hypothetical protein ACOYXT_16815 [Bacteroidota bacterium]